MHYMTSINLLHVSAPGAILREFHRTSPKRSSRYHHPYWND